MSVETLEMLCAKAADALAIRAGDFKAEDMQTPLHLMCGFKEVKFILNSGLPLCHFFWSLTRLGLCEFAEASPLGSN